MYLVNTNTSFSDKIFDSFNCISNKIATFKSFPGSVDNNALMVSGNKFYYFVLAEESEIQSYIDSLANTEIYYLLATPTEETIELPNLPTYKGKNIIEVDTKIQPSNMEISYTGKKIY